MKNLLGFVTGVIISTSLNAKIVWDPTIELTGDTTNFITSESFARCVAVFENTIHAVWDNYESEVGLKTPPGTYYSRSVDNGTTWEPYREISAPAGRPNAPSIAVSGDTVHVVYCDYRDWDNGTGLCEIYYNRSTNGGVIWESDRCLSESGIYGAWGSSISTTGNNVHVSWLYLNEIYYRHSNDGGTTWEPTKQLTTEKSRDFCPTISNSGNNVYLTWSAANQDNVYFMCSKNDGYNWSDERILSNNGPRLLSMTGSNNNIYLVWDNYYLHSSTDGNTWDPERQITDNGASSNPIITAYKNTAFVMWKTPAVTCYKYSINKGTSWNPVETLPECGMLPSVTIYGNNIHLVWTGFQSENGHIYYKHGQLSDTNIYEDSIPLEPSVLVPSIAIGELHLEYTLPVDCSIILSIFDATGRRIRELVSGKQEAGNHVLQWSIPDYLSKGIYYIVLTSQKTTCSKTIILN